MPQKSIRIATIVAVLALSLSIAPAAPAASAASAACDTRANHTPALLLECVTLEGVREHQAAFQAIADANGGNRFSGLPGYDKSVDYVVSRLRAAGYKPVVQAFDYFAFVELGPSALQQTAPGNETYVQGVDFGVIDQSDPGDLTAAVTAVDLQLGLGNTSTSGCEATDFAGFPAGNIALLQRGVCTFELKAENAAAAGATGIVIFNQGNTMDPSRQGIPAVTLSANNTSGIPVLGTTYALGATLAGTPALQMRVFANTVRATKTTFNVLAETSAGDPANVVMVGAHLDSVGVGPGINDNGSGSAAILEVAEQMARVQPVNKVRFAWWGAEESGLIGSTFYVNSLPVAERDKIALYLNFDMVGSPNHVFFIYDGDDSDGEGAGPGPAGSAEIEKTFERYFNSVNLPFKGTDFSGRSDYGPFIANGIPAGGLFTGAEGIKTAEEAAIWGGTAGISYDPCYHQVCDTYANVNLKALDANSDAIAYATIQNAMNAVELAQVGDELQAILDANPGTSLADKVEDVLAKVQSASAELSKSPPDLQAVLGNIEGAVGDLEAAVKEGLDGAQGLHLSTLLSASARQFASGAINEAVAQNGNRGKIREAQRSLAEGDALRASGKFKDAVSKYKDALSKAQGARR